MANCRSRLLALFLLLAFAGVIRGADGWAQLKLGMTAGDTMTAIGQPLMRTVKRGFEIWIYDNQAEVLLFGSLIGWTCPSSGDTPGRSMDIWQAAREGSTEANSVLSTLPMPAKPARPERETAAGRAAVPGFRYRQ